MIKAFLILEENDQALGWQGRQSVFPGYTRFSPVRFPLRTSALEEAQPKVSPQALEKEIEASTRRQQQWTDLAARYRQALERLRPAKSRVFPGAQAELDYVIFKTDNFAGYLDVLAAGYEAVAACDRAVLAKNSGSKGEMQNQLQHSRAAIDRAHHLAREAARQMIPFAHIPTEKYQLVRFNQHVIGWTEASRAALDKAMASVRQPSQ